MLPLVTKVSLALSLLSFGLWVYLVLRARPGRAQLEATQAGAQPQGGLSDVAKLVEALAKLSDSFAKAGPMVMALVAAIFFLLIAALGSGIEAVAAKP